MSSPANTIHFDHQICRTCGYDAGPNNGWFGPSPDCLDCKDDARRMNKTPENTAEAIGRAAEIMGTMVRNGATVDEAIAACQELHPGLGNIVATFGPLMKKLLAAIE